MKNSVSFIKTHASESVDGTFRPQLTSLIDVMTILLVFLIKSFSVEGNLITPSPDLELPISTSKKPPKPMYSLEITKTDIIFEGQVITDIKQFEKADSLLIPLLYDWMVVKKSNTQEKKKTSEVLIQCDKNTKFNIVKRVMFTCSKAGFVDFSVLTLEEE